MKHQGIENIKSCCSQVIKHRWSKPLLYCAVMFGLSYSGVGFAGDLLDPVQTPLKENFGTGSIVVKILYILEILYAVWMIIKTRDWRPVLGVLGICLFVTYAMQIFVFKS